MLFKQTIKKDKSHFVKLYVDHRPAMQQHVSYATNLADKQLCDFGLSTNGLPLEFSGPMDPR